MTLTSAQIDYAAGLAQVYGSAYFGDQDEDGAVLIGPPDAELYAEAAEAARWVSPEGEPEVRA